MHLLHQNALRKGEPKMSHSVPNHPEPIQIPEEQVAPLEAIAEGVIGLRIAFVNVFAVTHPDGSWTLIDAGIPFSAARIKHWAEKHFGSLPNAIVLTHGHFDHVSAARELSDAWDCPIFAHPFEFPYLTGEREYAAPNIGAGGGLMTLLSPIYPRGPIDLGNRLDPLPRDGNELSLAAMPGWTLLHTPGHTPGHVSFFRESDRTLLVGDAFCTTHPESFFEAAVAQQPEMHGPPAYFTSDWDAARASVQRLAGLDPVTVIPGHGKPISGPGVASELRRLAADFDALAVPRNRRDRVA
jgi:glyoxylase-like metal-dependent hydrolase (beta-lactamase superfamily II)